jgi:energy-coupling factor transport system permease protein
MTVAGAAVVLAFVLPGPWGPLGLAGALVALALVSRVAPIVLPAATLAGPLWLFLFVLHGLLGESPERAVLVGARLTAMLLAFLVLLGTVHPGRLVDALAARGVPFSAAYLFAATLQAVPVLRALAGRILEAQRCRGLRVRGSPARRVAALVPLAVPLALGALAEAETRALALEARAAFLGRRRTSLAPPGDTVAQRALRWLLALGTLVAVLIRLLG